LYPSDCWVWKKLKPERTVSVYGVTAWRELKMCGYLYLTIFPQTSTSGKDSIQTLIKENGGFVKTSVPIKKTTTEL
jgi:hypothetical protein